jgi:anti-sigma factor (TIGR02949 family)
MTNRNLRCEEALRLLAAYIDRELDHEPSEEVERHLETCRSCCSRADFERQLKSQLESLGKRELQPAFARRIHNLVGELTSGEDTGRPAH